MKGTEMVDLSEGIVNVLEMQMTADKNLPEMMIAKSY